MQRGDGVSWQDCLIFARSGTVQDFFRSVLMGQTILSNIQQYV